MKRLFLVFAFVIGSAVICFGQNNFYFPHIVNGNAGGVWKTTILLTNPTPNSAPASGSISFTQDTGGTSLGSQAGQMIVTWLDINGKSVGVGNTIPFQISGSQTVKYTSTGTGDFAGGCASVNASSPVSGTAIFSQYDVTGTKLIAEAGVPAATAVARQSVFIDFGGGYNTGVAYCNPLGVGVTLTLTAFNNSGASLSSTTQLLGSGNHKAAFLDELFPGIQPTTGTIQITSTSGVLAAISLRFAPTGVFTTLPPIPLASILAAPMNALARILSAIHAHVA